MMRKELSTAAVVLALMAAAVVLLLAANLQTQMRTSSRLFEAPLRSMRSIAPLVMARTGSQKPSRPNSITRVTLRIPSGRALFQTNGSSIRSQTAEGKMPTFNKKMTEAEIETLVLHVRAFKR